MKSRYLVHTLFSILMAAGLSSLYLFLPNSYQTIDNSLRDLMFLYRGEIPPTGQVAIIDLDEKSLEELGQWPWERTIIAKILENATAAGAGIIGFDIVFAEEDRTSPDAFAKRMGLNVADFPNNDKLFAQVIAKTPTIMGYVMDIDDEGAQNFEPPQIPAIFVERGLVGDSFVVQSKGVITNIPVLQDNAYSSGFFNNIPDESGMIRSVPMVMRYDGQIYPSLSFEMLRIITESNRVNIYYGDSGVDGVELNDIYIPTDRYGRLFVNFRGKARTFDYISAVDIYNNTVDPNRINGKLLLVGTSAAGLLDLRSIPFDNVFPGVEVHANVLDNILAGDFLARPSWAEAADILIILSIVILGGLIFTFLSAEWMVLAVFVGTYGLFELMYYFLFTEGIILNVLFPISTLVSTAAMSVLINYFFETRQKNLIRGSFAKKVSADVMEDLLNNPQSDVLAGKESEITVFFSDVRSFTTISEHLGSAEKLIKLLNIYMTPMVEKIVEQYGTVDKFIGDAIMAYWNAPKVLEHHQDAAVTASLNQLKALPEVNKEIKALFGIEIDFGIGLNTGIATVGEMGSTGRSDYTVIGDPVNLGSRLEGLCKPYGVRLIISEFTKAGLTKEYVIRDLDLVRVKGKTEPVAIYEVIDFGKASGELQAELDLYNKALINYRSSHFEEAIADFKELDEKYAGTKMYPMYVERCEQYMLNPPENFDGVYTFTTK